jgi:hypothetical protein
MNRLLIRSTYTLVAVLVAFSFTAVGFADDTHFGYRGFTQDPRYEYHEMADGFKIGFKRTPAQMRAAEAQEAGLAEIRRAEQAQREWAEVIELPESGIAFRFPITKQEARAAQQERMLEMAQRQQAQQICLLEAEEVERSVVEIADGKRIAFEEGEAVNTGIHLTEEAPC